MREALLGPEPYIWIVSDAMHQALSHLENLKAELVDNELLASDYPNAAGPGPIWWAGLSCGGGRARATAPGLLAE